MPIRCPNHLAGIQIAVARPHEVPLRDLSVSCIPDAAAVGTVPRREQRYRERTPIERRRQNAPANSELDDACAKLEHIAAN
jgi:hypothetical protein